MLRTDIFANIRATPNTTSGCTAVTVPQPIESSPISFCSRVGNYLVMLFLVSKMFYIANVIAQLFVLNSILSAEFNLYGFDIMRDQVGVNLSYHGCTL